MARYAATITWGGTMKRSKKQLAAIWAKNNPINITQVNEFLNPKQRYISRFTNINTGISAENEECLRCLKLWIKVLGEWNGFRVTDCNNIIEANNDTE